MRPSRTGARSKLCGGRRLRQSAVCLGTTLTRENDRLRNADYRLPDGLTATVPVPVPVPAYPRGVSEVRKQ
ncbi:hypothetical protein CABS01_14118 [Colletotrichum abscissum]|uniref:uncharacterized protein n=1 Tax=Colletotrichum abscissum TaxID=1671311 RepID=UPI0027D6C7A5|nr:uncharacterized protein CABS01_14118 [Colletotrichum abscissum]KAK1481920.1 hypothetical protein CABS01_14118 [Colletotrichum abscissum]